MEIPLDSRALLKVAPKLVISDGTALFSLGTAENHMDYDIMGSIAFVQSFCYRTRRVPGAEI